MTRIDARRMAAALVAVAVAAVTMTAGPSPVGSSTDSEQVNQFVDIELAPTGQVSWQNGQRLPAQVIVEASRPVAGVVEVADEPEGGIVTTWEFDLDLAAGSTATLPVVLTTGWNGVRASAAFRSGSQTLATASLRQGGNGPGSDGHVAILGIDDPPRQLTEIASQERLPTIELDGDLRGLDGASTLVATSVALRELGADTVERRTIDAWINGGGQLVVDGPTGSLDERYHQLATANPDRFRFGTGSILYDEDWRDGIPIGGYVGSAGLTRLIENQGLGWGSGAELAKLAGLALPGAGLIAVILLGYALVAGPGLFLALGVTRRQRAIWTVLPALAVVVAAGILTVGFLDRRGRSDAHITIVEIGSEGSRATTNLLLGSGFGGNREIETPEGWQYIGQGRISGQREVRLRVGRTTTQVGIEMPSGSSAVVRLTGLASGYDDLVTIDNIRAGAGGTIEADVTNNGEGTLREAVALLGNVRTEIGDLPPGEAVEVTIEPDTAENRTMRELLLWPRVQQQWNEVGPVAIPASDAEVTAAGAWTEWRIAQGTTISPENVIGVVAWTDELSAPVPGGPAGLTALLARAQIPSGLTSATGFATTSRLPSYDNEPIFEANFVGYAEDLRVTLDPGIDAEDLAVAVDRQSSAVALWIDGAWRYLDLPADGDAVIGLPPAAVIDGEVLVRSFQPEWAWGAGSTVRVVAGEGLDADAPVLGDTAEHRAAGGPGDERFAGPGGNSEDLEPIEIVEVDGPEEDEPFVYEGFVEPFTRAVFVVELAEGQRLTATMRSPTRDSYLELWEAGGGRLADNDDYGQGVDSQIVFEAPETGTYEVWARELSSQEIDYQLTLEVQG